MISISLLTPTATIQSPEEKLAELKKFFFYKLKGEWTSKKPFAIHWTQNTKHLTDLKDWLYLHSICRTAEHTGRGFSKTFWGSLKSKTDA